MEWTAWTGRAVLFEQRLSTTFNGSIGEGYLFPKRKRWSSLVWSGRFGLEDREELSYSHHTHHTTDNEGITEPSFQSTLSTLHYTSIMKRNYMMFLAFLATCLSLGWVYRFFNSKNNIILSGEEKWFVWRDRFYWYWLVDFPRLLACLLVRYESFSYDFYYEGWIL